MSSAAAKEECPICLDDDYKHPVKCEYCPMEACRSCCERYILEKNTITCMDISCNREWTRKYVESQFTQSFIRKHRQTIIFEKERQTFPYAIRKMARLEEIKYDLYKIIEILKDNVINTDKSLYYTVLSIANILFEKILKYICDANFNYISMFLYHIDYHIERIYNTVHRYIAKYYYDDKNTDSYIDNEYSHLRNLAHITHIFDVINDLISNRSRPSEEKREITNVCPTPSCNGILDAEWYCILCKNTTCSACLEKKDDEHKCNNDTVETVKLLKTDTKPCPKCKANIYKIDGCDQMWCIKCHTAFSWRTGAIEKKIHNPHYYEWMRSKSASAEGNNTEGNNTEGNNTEGTRVEGEIQQEPEPEQICEDIELNEHHVTTLMTSINKYILNCDETIHRKDKNNKLYRFEDDIRHVIHLREVELIKCANVIHDNNQFITLDNYYKFSMKMRYLNKKINENVYKTFLEEEQNEKEMNTELFQLIQTWIVIKTDILKRFIIRVNDAVRSNEKMIYDDIAGELDELKDFITSHLRDIEKIYKQKINILVM